MAFPSNRQESLNPILVALIELPGIENVRQDDFDSTAITVWFDLKDKGGRKPSRNKVYAFQVPVRAIKSQLKRLFIRLGVNYRVVDYPIMQTEYVSVHDREPGESITRKIGFDQVRFGIEVFV